MSLIILYCVFTMLFTLGMIVQMLSDEGKMTTWEWIWRILLSIVLIIFAPIFMPVTWGADFISRR